jgi:orotidine-5'-phosphate decarboxylase
MTDARSQLIVALDLPDRISALAAVKRLAGHVGYFKLGFEIFIREGPGLVEEISSRGEKVFLDLKLHDIPNTVRGAVRSACRLGVQMLTLHAAGGSGMLAAAREAAESEASPPLLLAVTALTSLSREDMQRIGIGETPVEWVERLADLAHQCGIPGIVASSWELPHLKAKFRNSLRFVIPGIRPSGAATQDQSRTATPAEAIRLGADFLVVGRPILQAQDPSAAADLIVEEMRRAASVT